MKEKEIEKSSMDLSGLVSKLSAVPVSELKASEKDELSELIVKQIRSLEYSQLDRRHIIPSVL